jgi:hypothetical protein
MSRFCFAAIYTAFVLPGLLLAPPADALWHPVPSVGSALGVTR